MKHNVGSTLLLNVISNRLFTSVFSNRACKIPVRPEFTAPQLLLYLIASLENFACSYALYQRDNFRNAVCGNCLHKKMYVILFCSDFQKFYMEAFFYLQTYFLHLIINLFVENSSPVFRWKYEVIHKNRVTAQ